MQTATDGAGGLTTTLDIAALVSAIVWPLLLVIVVLLFRDRLVEAVKQFAPQVKSFSIGAVSIELATAEALPLQMTGAVDLRHAGQSGDVNDSTLRSFYAQIQDPTRLDYAIVDLGDGREWLTSRLFILAVILSRMRGLRALVFVESAGHLRRRLVGVSECEKVRWRLAMRFPWLEAALAHAESAIWPLNPVAGGGGWVPIVSNEQGRVEWSGGNPEPAAQILRSFLDKIQLPAGGVPKSEGWEELPATIPPKLEHAQWLTAAQLEQIMGSALNQSSVSINELNRCNETARARILLAHSGRWVALTREDRVFDRLLDRASIVETVAQRCLEAATP